MFLQIVTLAGDVAGHFEAVGQTDARNFAQRRIRFFRGCRVDARAYPALLRAGLHRWHLVARELRPSRISDQLVYRRHSYILKHGDRPTLLLRRCDRAPLPRNNIAPSHKGAEPRNNNRAASRWLPTASPEKERAYNYPVPCGSSPFGSKAGEEGGRQACLPQSQIRHSSYRLRQAEPVLRWPQWRRFRQVRGRARPQLRAAGR